MAAPDPKVAYARRPVQGYKRGVHTLPQHPRRRPVDPQLPKGRKKFLPTVVTSLLAVAIVMFAKGDLPQVDHFFAAANELVRSHNDDVVNALIHYGPFALIAFGAFVGGYMLLSSIRGRRKTA